MEKETILIVDDDIELRELLSILLSQDYNVVDAANGRQGLALAEELHPDLILLDMNMPRMTGIEMLEALRTTDCTSPVIFITAAGSEYVAVQAFKLGVYDYLPKPFTRAEIEEVIDNALRQTRLLREKERLAKQLATAEVVRQTVATLSHHINNKLMVIQGGLSLLYESEEWRTTVHDDPLLNRIFTDSQQSATYISSVLRVLQRIANVELSSYHEGEMILDIKAALKKELEPEQSEEL